MPVAEFGANMTSLAEHANKLLDFSQKFDVQLLDNIVNCMYTSSGVHQNSARDILTAFKEHPDAWTRVDGILEFSMSQQTKYYALQILENVIKVRWKVLPRSQCEGIRKYIVSLIIKTSSDSTLVETEKVYLEKLNMILVQILKYEWPQNWPTFISDIVGASKTNESLCQNNMTILKLLSEEVFDFSSGQMTQTEAKYLKEIMCSEFAKIFELCQFVMDNSQSALLVGATLETLPRFLNWIPLGYIFETNLVTTLIYKFLNVPLFRNVTMKALTEIAGVQATQYDEQFIRIFTSTLAQLKQMLPTTTNIKDAYKMGSDDEQNFIQNLSLFLCTFLKEHGQLIEKNSELESSLIYTMTYIELISEVDEKESFKICLECWNTFASDHCRKKSSIQSQRDSIMLPTNKRELEYQNDKLPDQHFEKYKPDQKFSKQEKDEQRMKIEIQVLSQLTETLRQNLKDKDVVVENLENKLKIKDLHCSKESELKDQKTKMEEQIQTIKDQNSTIKMMNDEIKNLKEILDAKDEMKRTIHDINVSAGGTIEDENHATVTYIFCDVEFVTNDDGSQRLTELNLISVTHEQFVTIQQNCKNERKTSEINPRIVNKIVVPINPKVEFTSRNTKLNSNNLKFSRPFDINTATLLQIYFNQFNNACIVTHGNMDVKIIFSEFKRLNFDVNSFNNLWFVDTQIMFRDFDKSAPSNESDGTSLKALFNRFFGMNPPKHHRAEHDTTNLMLICIRELKFVDYVQKKHKLISEINFEMHK